MNSIAVSVAIGVALTPLVVHLWALIFPVGEDSEFSSLSPEQMKARNAWIDNVATGCMMIGAVFPLLFWSVVPDEKLMWLVVSQPGAMVMAHFAWIAAVTLPQGRVRFREFWRFYELRWGIGLRGIRLVYVPAACLGLVAWGILLW